MVVVAILACAHPRRRRPHHQSAHHHQPAGATLLLVLLAGLLLLMMAAKVSATDGDAVRAAANLQEWQDEADEGGRGIGVIPGEEEEEHTTGAAARAAAAAAAAAAPADEAVHAKAPITSRPEDKAPPTNKSLGEILRIAGLRALGGGIPGAMAGVMQVVCLMWLRTINNYQNRYGTTFKDAVAILYKQGGIGRFYEGKAGDWMDGCLVCLCATPSRGHNLPTYSSTPPNHSLVRSRGDVCPRPRPSLPFWQHGRERRGPR